MNDLLDNLERLIKRIAKAFEQIGIEEKQTEIKDLEFKMSEVDFWNDQEKATKLSKRAAEVKDEVDNWENLMSKVEDLYKLTKEFDETHDYSMKDELEEQAKELENAFAKMEFDVFLSGEYDRENAVLSIHAGAGGTDAQDWAEMLLRMYLRYAEKKNWKVNFLDKSDGSEAGI